MVHSDSYLYLSRHNIYYFRAIVPEGIKEDLHKLEYRRSMQTRSPHVAQTIGRALRVCFESNIEGVRANMISWEELKKKLDDTLVQLIAQEKDKLRKVGPYPVIADDIWRNNTIPSYLEAIQTISELRSDKFLDVPSDNIPEFAVALAEKILKSSNIQLDRSSDQFMQFCEATVSMYLEFTRRRIGLNEEAKSFLVTNLDTVVQPSGIDTNKPSGKLISEVVEKYCSEMMVGGNWTQKTESEYRAIYKLLINITNNMPVSLIDFQVSQYFKEILLKLPSNMNKKPLYRDKPVKEVAAMKIPKEDLLSISKVNAYFSRISQLFTWACKNGYAPLNPFTGIGIKKKGIPDSEKRIPFENSDLTALFSSSIFQKAFHAAMRPRIKK